MATGTRLNFDDVNFDDVASETVKVVVLCRPMNETERSSNCTNVVKVFPRKGCIKLQCKKFSPKLFNFDAVYDCGSPKVIYDEQFHPLVASFMSGFSGTIFTHGQSGSGKSFTMEGDPEHEGVIPSVMKEIFHNIKLTKNDAKFNVTASYFEIEHEQIFDLLLKPKKLVLEEGNNTGVPNVTTVVCNTLEEMEKLLVDGKQNRIGNPDHCTNLGSHAIFVINIESQEPDGKGHELVRKGQLKLVDLTGKRPKTNAASMKDKDFKSLEVFGNVISALAEGKTRIPYANSRLTALLQDSLGGSSKCIMIANISPASCNYHETVLTLRDAKKLQSIRNRPLAIILKRSLDKASVIARLPFNNTGTDEANDAYFEDLVQMMDEVYIEESVAQSIMKSVKKQIDKKKGKQIKEDFEQPDEAIEELTRDLDATALSDPRKAAEFFQKCMELLPTIKKK